MKVRFSRQARSDIAEITKAISQANPRRAETYINALEEACIALSDMPDAFQIFARRNGKEIRRKPHGSYIILYRVTTGNVDILRIIHGARDYQSLFRPKA